MPKNSKANREKASNNVPESIIKDARTPEDNTDVELTGKPLEAFLDDTQENPCAE